MGKHEGKEGENPWKEESEGEGKGEENTRDKRELGERGKTG